METGAPVREPEEAVNVMRDLRENLVIGGGPAGSMLAMRLAAAGRDVALLEKENGPHHKVCGEFLSGEAVAYLEQAGIEPRKLGACTIDRVRLTSRKRTVEAPLPFPALSLSRHVLDEALLRQAENAGCEVIRGAFAERLEKQDGNWTVRLREGDTMRAQAVFLATGKHDLKAWEGRGGTQTDLVGFKMHWRLTPAQIDALRGVMELFLFRGGYGGLSLVEDEPANLCFVVQRNRLRSSGGWAALLPEICEEVSLLRERLEDAMPCWKKPLAISPIPYGYIADEHDGIWRLGDQAAVIPSFTGDGMSIALHSGSLAARMFLLGKSAEEYVRSVADDVRNSMRIASALSRAMVTASGRMLAPSVLSILPDAMRRIASWTRIPDQALLLTAIPGECRHAGRPVPTA